MPTSPRLSFPRVLATPLACALLAGCDATPAAPDAGAPDAAAPAPTWHGEVAALLARHCVACHAADGIAPFALDDYADAARLAPLIAGAARTRQMPPFLVDNSGDCNTFRDARWLDEADIATLEAWADAGAPLGDATLPAPPRTPPARLDGEIVSVSTGVDYVPRSGDRDDYRCFVSAPLGADDDMVVTGFDVHPGEPRIVHHVIVYAPRSDAAIAQARALDDADAGPGYTCYGTAGVQATVLAAWAPGGGATTYPPGTGMALTPGAPLVIQVHYNTLAGADLADRTAVDLQIGRDQVTRGRFLPVADLGLSLPPGQPEVSAGAAIPATTYPSIDGPVLVRGLFPHMHTLGTTLSVAIRRADGGTTCVAEVPRWDFHWQMLYFLEAPLVLEPGDTLEVACTFDTRARDTTTVWGESTTDEMCLVGLFVTPIEAP